MRQELVDKSAAQLQWSSGPVLELLLLHRSTESTPLECLFFTSLLQPLECVEAFATSVESWTWPLLQGTGCK